MVSSVGNRTSCRSSGPNNTNITRGPGGRTYVDGGAGNDEIEVRNGRKEGLEVIANCKKHTLSKAQSQDLFIRGNAGNDLIRVDSRVKKNITIEGGPGHDALYGGSGKNKIDAGPGHDYVQGGKKEDILDGGAGKDTIYGLGGADAINGGRDDDYLDGGRGKDRVDGEHGDDILIGGRDPDGLNGGPGKNLLAEGPPEVGRDVGRRISVRGDENFRARINSDLDALRSLPYGRDVLEGLDRTKKSVTIRETRDLNGYAGPTHGAPGQKLDANLLINPSWRNIRDETLSNPNLRGSWQTFPPIAIFGHELSHAHDIMSGTADRGETNGVPNVELSAVGVPFDRNGDGRLDPNTKPYTENKLRRALGLPERAGY